MSFKSTPLIGIQGIQRNYILEILANLGDQHAALGVSWDGCEHPSFSFALAFAGQEKQEEDKTKQTKLPISS